MSRSDASPFHAGEQAVQTRVGVRERAEYAGRRMIRDAMPDQHRALFEALPTLVVGTIDAEGRPWASVLVGAPGFVRSPDARSLVVAARPLDVDPARIEVGAPIAVLGLQHDTRRRNRANGVVEASDAGGFTVRVQQSFGNCPQFIHPRTPAPAATARPPRAERGTRVSAAARALIARADTFFVASVGVGALVRDGPDVSHRGGPPGVAQVSADGTSVSWPEYSGNGMFNTVGNLAVNPRAGLLFLDFDRGAWVSITGRTELSWGEEQVEAIGLTVDAVVHVEDALPLAWTDVGG